jgi:alkyldihydroxyacetonephosphate synthase
MRAVFQAGLRPAVARLYDPFDAMLARIGSVKRPEKDRAKREASSSPSKGRAPGMGAVALRNVLRTPNVMNELIEGMGGKLLGGAMLLMIFEGVGNAPALGAERARAIVERMSGTFEGEGPARRWMQHRYSVSYRQAPVYAAGAFVDTMEVAAKWSSLGALYDGVRKALGKHVFVMAHFSHAYADGCCIYFSFAGSAAKGRARSEGWDAASEETYDKTWQAALDAAIAAGGTLAHHHGVGRSKAPRLAKELGAGIDVVRALQRAFDPHGILNPGNLLPPADPPPYVPDAQAKQVVS